MVLLLASHGALKRPDRFFYPLTKSNPRSWLVIGSYIFTAYSAALAAW